MRDATETQMPRAAQDVPQASPQALPRAHRLRNVIRLHVANPWTTLITPWIIFLAVFALNLAIWYAVVVAAGGSDKVDPDAFEGNGGGTWIFAFLVVVAVQSMSLTFKFALGMGFTRSDYYLGTVAYFALLAIMFATGITLLALVENATGGWGVNGRFFMPWHDAGFSALQVWYLILVMALLFIMVGIAAATMWVRWAAVGLYVFFGAVAVLIVGWVWATTLAGKWGEVGDFFTGTPPVAIASMTLPVTLASALFGYVMLRRATPRG